MKRKRRCGRRNPKMASEEGANKGSLNVCLNTQDNWIPVYSDNAEFDSRTQADTPQNDRNESRQQEGFQNLEAVNAKMVGSMSLFPETDAATPANLSKKGRSKVDKSSRGRASSRLKPISNTELVHGRRPSQKDPKLPHQDPLYKEQELKTALPVIRKIMKMDAAEPFNVPMDPIALGIPDYFDVVDTPMDFGTICNNLENGVKYKNSKDVFRDVQCIWDNFSKYNNEGHYILELMKRVKKNFTKFWTEAGLHWEQPQEINGYSRVTPTESTMKRSTCGHRSALGSMTDYPRQQDEDLMDFSQCQPHQSSHSDSMSYQLRQKPQQSQLRSGQELPSHSLACRNIGSADAAVRRTPGGLRFSVRQYADNPIDLQHNETGLSQPELHQHQPSLSHSQPCQPQQGSCCCHPSPGQPQPYPQACTFISNGHSHLHSRESTVRQSPCGHWCPMSHMQRNQTGISQPQLHQHPPSLSCNQPSQTQQKCVPCHSSFEQPQPSRPHAEVDLASKGHLCSPPHAESVIRYRKYGPCPVGPMTDYTSHEQQAPNQMLPRQPSASYGQPNQLQQGTCQVKLNSSQPQPLQPQTGTEVESADLCSPPPAESMIRCSKRGPKCPMRPMTDYASHEQQDQLGSSQTLLHHPLPSYGQPNQPQSSQPQTSMGMGTAGPIRQKTRGRRPTWCLNVWNSEDKISIATNKLGQPIGPETPILTNFLGTIARNGHMAPLNYVDWRALPDANKENMWQQVQSKFDIDPISKSWVLKSLGKKWKDWKAELKANHYTTHEIDEERLADRDERVLPDQWRILISFWNSKEAKELSIRNKAIRSLQKTSHTTGRKSFARVREEQRAKRPDGKEPSRAELFILTRTRKDGRPINEASSALISELREQAAQQQGGRQNGTVKDDIFFKVMGEDRHGRVRTYGLGPAPSDLMGVTPSRAEAVRIVSEANAEVRDMKERMVAMEQTCAQMAAQMTTMMSMMSNMQKLPAEHGSPSEGLRVRQDADVSTNSGVSPELQVYPSSSVQGAPLHQRHATNRGKTQNTSTRKVSGRRS